MTTTTAMYSGKKEGLTFEKFDDMVISWGREKYGDKYANALWKNELLSLSSLDLSDDLDCYGFETYCEWMFDILSLDSPKHAAELWKSDRFWTKKWQIEQRQRQREKMYCYLEKITNGEAKRQLIKRGVAHMPTMRRYYFDRFGAGQPEILAERTRIYLLGMPGKDGEVFPPRCNMETKLDLLETEREYLLEMCPKDKRDTYEDAKEHTLVRILLKTLPAEYDGAVKSVRDLMKLRKYGVMGDFSGISNKDDHTRTNYDSEWLPPYDELRVELVNSWQLQERRRKDLGKSIRKHPGYPTLPILQGHDQPGPHHRNCFRCGETDHISGDPACKAGPLDIWKGAPASWKARFGKGKGKGKGKDKARGRGKGVPKGKGKDKPYLRNLGARLPPRGESSTAAPNGICHNWARGNGYCKYGPNCNFKHEGPQGGGKRKDPFTSLLTAGNSKRARKKIVSLLINDFKDTLSQTGSETKSDHKVEEAKEENEGDGIYRLLRGAPSYIITRSSLASAEYRPHWIRGRTGPEEGMGYDSAPTPSFPPGPAQVSFFTSLMIKGSGEGINYVPVRLRGGADDSDSSPDDEVVPIIPAPRFKIGDRVIWKRRLQDQTIQGTGTITKVQRQPPLIHHVTGAAYNHHCYEIDTAALMVPGLEGYVGENLIRSLVPPAGSWRAYVESQRSPTKTAEPKPRVLKREHSPDENISSERTETTKGTNSSSTTRDSNPKHRKTTEDPQVDKSTNQKGEKIKKEKREEAIDGHWSKNNRVPKLDKEKISIGPRRGGVPFKTLLEACLEDHVDGPSSEDGAEERLIKEKGLSPGPKKWYGIKGGTNDLNDAAAPFEYPRASGTMEGKSSVNTKESDFKRKSREHERNSRRAPMVPEEGSSCVTDPPVPALRPPRSGPVPASRFGPEWERDITAAIQAFESYKILMGMTITNLERQLTVDHPDDEKVAQRVQTLENLRDDMGAFVTENLLRKSPGRGRRVSTRRREARKRDGRGTSEDRKRDRTPVTPFDNEVNMVIRFPRGRTTALVKMITRPDDGIGFEGPVELSSTLSDLLVLKGVRRGIIEGTSSDPDSSDSESESESDSSESQSAEEGEEESDEDNDQPPGDDNTGGSFTNLSPASDYHSDELRDQAKWGSRCKESKSGGRRGNPKPGHPLNQSSMTRAVSPASTSRVIKAAGVRVSRWLHSDEVQAYHDRVLHLEMKPRFKINDIVHYWRLQSNDYWVGVVKGEMIPDAHDRRCGLKIRYAVEPEGEGMIVGEPYIVVNEWDMKPIEMALQNLSNQGNTKTCLPVSGSSPLLPLNYVGIDTCSALSVSTQREDFTFLDESLAAKESVSLRGIGGEQSTVGGRGPMLISALDEKGYQVFMVDVSGVFLDKPKSLQLRIMSQQRMKAVGFDLVQNKYGDGDDFLVYRNQSGKGAAEDTVIPLKTDDGILVLNTMKVRLDEPRQKQQVDAYILELLQKDSEGEHLFHITKDDVCPVFVINEGKLTDVELVRLDHWRHAHRQISGKRHEERCPACEQAKHRTGSFKRNHEFYGTGTATNIVYWRLYCDGYGGQRSMGVESYQGAKGGFIFVCPVSGKIKTKLYGTTKQFPAILYQVCQEIESEGFVVREIYVDTFSVNISRAAEDVASMFKVRLIPVSAGTPQEMAYAERAVQTIAQMSRALMAGAPHLPQFCWGLSDLHANLIHDVMPQKRHDGLSPYERTKGREPNLDAMFIRVFGCACQYSPHQGADHKRAVKTQWGWYLGMQWPMVLILRPADNKVISVSRMKVHCHEQCYAKFDPLTQERPLINFTDFSLLEHEIDDAIAEAGSMDKETLKKFKEDNSIPKHVQSIKSLSDFNRNSSFNKAEPYSNLPESMRDDFPQESQLGEETPAIERLSIAGLLEEIRMWKAKASSGHDVSTTDQIIKALTKAENELVTDAPKRGELRRQQEDMAMEGKAKHKDNGYLWTENKRVRDLPVKAGAKVRIKTIRFGKVYAQGLPEYTFGKVIDVIKDQAKVKWQQGDVDMVTRLSLRIKRGPVTSLPVLCGMKRNRDLDENSRIVAMESEREINELDTMEGYLLSYPKEWNASTILPIMEVGGAITTSGWGGTHPRDFYEALVRPDWREWVQAVKDEMESWTAFQACEEVSYHAIEKGASVIPLGELFTIKRTGKFKFRQIALGNLLKEGKDYAETFASTISGDGIRWFCAIAASCGKPIYGWDAKTGYLQTEQRIPIYAYLPSHHGYSSLEFEELALLRAQLVKLLLKDGLAGVKKFSSNMRKERRIRPKTVLKLNRSIYGVPDAGQSFAMFMQSLHLKKCGMVQSEMDPCIYYQIIQRDAKVGETIVPILEEFLIAITWVDDVRYFGTQKMVKEYEKVISSNCKCTLEGISKEFVSIQIDHQVDAKILELRQEDYWVKAIERFKEFLGKDGPKLRLVPLSAADDKLLVEPTDDEIAEAAHLPFPSLLGVVQYPTCYTKLEMKYSMSVLSRWRTKWGTNHFRILLKALEYGFSTRKTGLRYDGNPGGKVEVNIMEGFADSNLGVPRSQGSRSILMNKAAITCTSKRHTTTDDSTMAAELTEAHLLACEIEGFRVLMEEVGLKQIGPTRLYQDNKAAIQVAMNRGSLSRKTRGTDLKVLTLRNKVEDLKVVPIYLNTLDMLADIGTKALDPKLFCRLRDMLCGYAERISAKHASAESRDDEPEDDVTNKPNAWK